MHKKILQADLRSLKILGLEQGSVGQPGLLEVKFYHSDSNTQRKESEPVQSHLKLTIIDGEITVLGSGNMDRASWYTSQELGIALISKHFAESVREGVDGLMRARTR